MRAGTRRRHDKWMAKMLRVIEREGPISTTRIMVHPKMKNCAMSRCWVLERLRELADMSIIEYDYTRRKWMLQ